MFGSLVLDVAIGLAFVFLAVSLATTAISEVVSTLTKLRHETLKDGVGKLVNDPEFKALALDLYNHALVNPLSQGVATQLAEIKTKPAYIDGRNFSIALIDCLAKRNPGPSVESIIDSIGDQPLKNALMSLYQAAGKEEERFRLAVANWFDASMDRVSGFYKRRMQVIGFVVAFVVAMIFDADAFRLVRDLWRMPNAAAELGFDKIGQPAADAALEALENASLLGWPPTWAWTDILWAMPGCFVVALASLLGAPFWFGVLQRITQIPGVGPAPKKAEGS